MNYQKFKKQFLEELEAQLAVKYPDYKVSTDQIEKVGTIKTGVFILKKHINKPESKDIHRSVYVYYIEDLCEEYSKISHIITFSKYVADFIDKFFSLEPITIPDPKIFTDKNYFLHNIFLQVINYSLNEHLKDTLPHRKFLDLMVTYRLFVTYNEENQGMYSSLLSNQIISNLDVSEEELYQSALKNTDRILPPVLTDNRLTSDKGYYGSSFLVCRDCLRQLKEDLYILPVDSDSLYVYKKSEVKDINDLRRSFADHSLSFFKQSNKPPMDLFVSTNIYYYNFKSDSLEILEV